MDIKYKDYFRELNKNQFLLSLAVFFLFFLYLYMLRNVVEIVLAFLAIGVIIKLFKKNLTDYGLGLPNILGYRLTLIGIIVSIPFGLWIMIGQSHPPNVSLLYLISLLVMIPEHFLISATLTALILPIRKLPYPVPLDKVEGTRGEKILRWLGLSQKEQNNKILNWFGLNWSILFAIILSGITFGALHIGKSNQLEVALSFIGGIAVAYITVRTHSIWPAVISHWTLNLIPMAMFYLLK